MIDRSRSEYSIMNILTGFGGYFLNTLLGYICRIVFVQCLNADYLGINGLLTNILSMLSLAELGIGGAIGYALYKPIAEENIEKKKRLENDDLNLRLENILHIKEEMTKIGIYDQLLKIQVKNEYILSLDNLNLTINLGNATNLKDKTYYIKSIMERENGKAGTINVNGNLNEGFVPYFTENQ